MIFTRNRGRRITTARPTRSRMSLCLHCQQWSEDCQHVDAGDSEDLTGDYCASCRESALTMLATADDDPITETERIELVRQMLEARKAAGRPASKREARQLGEWLLWLNNAMTSIQMVIDGDMRIVDIEDGAPCFDSTRKGAA